MRETGIYQTLGELDYFIPHPLPPASPELNFSTELMELYGQASFALGQLNEMSLRLPDANRFIKAYVVKEALLSSAIEGIHTTMIEIFTYPFDDVTLNKNTQLVFNYTQALETAINMITKEELPLITRVILQAHKSLMSQGEGEKAAPGQFRKLPVKVGNLVPPPAIKVWELMGQLEQYINLPSALPPLIRAGLVHVHFETIHPFLDGNGRIGRLLIVLMLIYHKILNAPILYPSYYFKKYHGEYYQKLDRVRTHGDFEGWIIYYLKAIYISAIDAHTRAKEIEQLEIQFKQILLIGPQFKKMREMASQALSFMFRQPITTTGEMSRQLDKAYNTVQHTLKAFIKLGWVSENVVHKRNKLYRFEPYLKLLEKEYLT